MIIFPLTKIIFIKKKKSECHKRCM